MGSTVNVYLRHGGPTADVATLAMTALGGLTCFTDGEDFGFQVEPATAEGAGWVEFAARSIADLFGEDELPGTALEPVHPRHRHLGAWRAGR